MACLTLTVKLLYVTSYFIETSNKPPPGLVETFSWYTSCVTTVCADKSATNPSMSAFLWNLRSPSLGTNFAAHWIRSSCSSAQALRCDSVSLSRTRTKPTEYGHKLVRVRHCYENRSYHIPDISKESAVKHVHIQFTQTLCQLTKWVSDVSYITNSPTKIWQKISSETMFHSTALSTSR